MKKRTAKNFGLNDSSRVHLFFEKNHGFSRSRISSRFAENFIESVILD